MWAQIYADYELLERGTAFNSELFTIARMLVRLAEETAKPNAERLREYAEASLDSLKQQLFSEAPIYDDLETVKLADSLGYADGAGGRRQSAGQADAGRTSRPRSGPPNWSRAPKLADVAVRKKLADGGKAAIDSSDDPMIALARLVDRPARKVRKIYEDKVEEPLRQAYAKIAKARFAIEGDSDLSRRHLHAAAGLRRGEGLRGPGTAACRPGPRSAAPSSMPTEHGNVPPFDLPDSWLQATRTSSTLDTPFNFVCTADIIGGNSGSPVVNRARRAGGHHLRRQHPVAGARLRLHRPGRPGRSSVHSSAILEALRKVYDAGDAGRRVDRQELIARQWRKHVQGFLLARCRLEHPGRPAKGMDHWPDARGTIRALSIGLQCSAQRLGHPAFASGATQHQPWLSA